MEGVRELSVWGEGIWELLSAGGEPLLSMPVLLSEASSIRGAKMEMKMNMYR